MNFKLSVLAAVTALMLPAAAANAVVIGSSDGGNCYPFMCNDSGTSVGQSIHYQQIYLGSLFGGPSSFDTISFSSWTGSGTVLGGTYAISFSTTSAAIGAGYPIGPLANTAGFFTGTLGGAVGASFSITGTSYDFNPADGNLVMDIVVTNQDNVPNGSGNSYNWADYTGVQTTRAYDLSGRTSNGLGALVTEFNTVGTVPEPTTWALMIAGFGMVGLAARRRRVGAYYPS